MAHPALRLVGTEPHMGLVHQVLGLVWIEAPTQHGGQPSGIAPIELVQGQALVLRRLRVRSVRRCRDRSRPDGQALQGGNRGQCPKPGHERERGEGGEGLEEQAAAKGGKARRGGSGP